MYIFLSTTKGNLLSYGVYQKRFERSILRKGYGVKLSEQFLLCAEYHDNLSLQSIVVREKQNIWYNDML